MIKVIKLISVILLLILVVLTGFGLFAPNNVYLSKTMVIKSPSSVVWQYLSDIENYPSWRSDIRQIKLKDSSRIIKGTDLYFFMNDYEKI